MKRDKNLDALKGFAILLVVLGHSIQYNISNFQTNLVFGLIYSVHMPLFMFLSGYLAFNRPVNLPKKFEKLIIPYFSWGEVWFILSGHSNPKSILIHLGSLIKSPYGGLWFLWVLFFCFVLLAVSNVLEKRLGGVSIFIVAITVQFLPINALGGVNIIKWYFLFFCTGLLIAKYKHQFDKLKLIVLVLLSLTYIVLSAYAIPDPLRSYTLKTNLFSLYSFIVAISGIAFGFLVIPRLKNIKAYDLLCLLGTMTLEIYAIHPIFLTFHNISVGTGSVRVLSGFLLALLCAIGIKFVLQKFNYIRLIFGVTTPNVSG